MMKTTLEIQNLKCGGCEATIYTKLVGLQNIEELFIDANNSTITFNYTLEEDLKRVKDTLFNIGYPILGEENRLVTKARSYVSCAMGKMKK